MGWDLLPHLLTGMWDGMIMTLWYFFCIIGTVAGILGIYDTLTKNRNKKV